MEIERKFIVLNSNYKTQGSSSLISQGYLNSDKSRTVRIRIYGDNAFITIKSKVVGISRQEFEYPIPVEDARFMMDELCEKPVIQKIRYKILYKENIWEVDEFLGENEGLVIAEIELKSEDQKFETPDWIGKEVTGELKYYNSSLIKNPYNGWKK
jgi:CYTH domain-containing protein